MPKSLFLFICFFWILPLWGQEEGAIGGRIYDELSGDPVEAMQLSLLTLDGALKLSAESNSKGQFSIYNIPPGQYILQGQKEGYALLWVTEVKLAPLDLLTLEIGMEGQSFLMNDSLKLELQEVLARYKPQKTPSKRKRKRPFWKFWSRKE
ncbi:carboxypeptidase-like regulatory domain-containing protein [Saprospira sp. CCB-QB6]|uniref:carboxypeptidase-like regulatory domain-containing protein n=1 Tax=Saprospira sp. CCB-QB6 TaxID=3023936 RepID=UPI00234A2839|nr:carboxypeptidase-like regulatory domain-containing protein [Saprospira sp. CCB-QB6]WCL81234.1 carboxypeptidase-like regulatory domain-containing protein [Saprospira sp. CCB-QB6]